MSHKRFLVVFAMVLMVIICNVYISGSVWRRYKVADNVGENSDPDILNKELFKKLRHNCDNETIFCFDDDDCTSKCVLNSSFKCKQGLCKKRDRLEVSGATDQCQSELGFVALYVGLPSIGTHTFVCKSLDPGIAYQEVSTMELKNRMCIGGKIELDYRNKYPVTSDCKCGEHHVKVRFPANELVREHIACAPRAEMKKGDFRLLEYNNLLST